MSINETILELLNKGASINEISLETGLTNKQLFYRLNLLKFKGYSFKQKYYYNGDIVYELIKELSISNPLETTILSSRKDNAFKALIISDTHLGSERDRLDCLNNVYNYCIKEGINIIINAGDLIDGCNFKWPIKHKTIQEQINYAIDNHPFDKNIINFICLGNHDYDSLENNGVDIANVLKVRRPDLVPIGYGTGILNIKNDQIIVRHQATKSLNEQTAFNNKLLIHGHSHKMKVVQTINGNVSIYAPSLSDLYISNNEIMPGAVLANIKFINGFFSAGTFYHLLVTDKEIYKISEFQFDLSKGKNLNTLNIENIDERIPSENGKVLTKNK